MTTTVAIAMCRSVIDLSASAIRYPWLVVQQEIEGRVADQEEDQIVEAEQSEPRTESPVIGAALGQQVLARARGGDHEGDEQRQQDEGREQVARTRHRGDGGDRGPGRGQADVGEQEDEREGEQPGSRVEKEEREDRHRNELEDDQVDHQSAGLGREQDGPIHRRQPDEVETALLPLGDEEAIDGDQRGEQQRRDEHAGGELTRDMLPVEAEAEDHECRDREERHRGDRAQRPQLDSQVLAEERGEGDHPSSTTKSEPSVAAPRSWLTTSRVRRSPAAIRGAISRRASGSRCASGSSNRSSSGSCRTARQMSIRCFIPALSSATRSPARELMPTASIRTSIRGAATSGGIPCRDAASSRFSRELRSR